MMVTLFRCQVYLTGQMPSNWGHHLYHCKVDGDLSHDRHKHIDTNMSPRAYGLTSLSEKTRKSNHLQMLEQRHHLHLNYFKTLKCWSGRESNPSLPHDRLATYLLGKPGWEYLAQKELWLVKYLHCKSYIILPKTTEPGCRKENMLKILEYNNC